MMTRLIGACVLLAVGMTGCTTSMSQKWAVQAVAFDSANRLVVLNAGSISDSDLATIGVVADTAKGYLDESYELLTDDDPDNDEFVGPFLSALEDELLPQMNTLAQEDE